jgi:hypothetical protein
MRVYVWAKGSQKPVRLIVKKSAWLLMVSHCSSLEGRAIKAKFLICLLMLSFWSAYWHSYSETNTGDGSNWTCLDA